MEFLAWLENTGFSTWVRESNSPFAYTLVLFLHSLGMAFLVGLSSMIALRLLGLMSRLPLAPLASFFPLMVIGFWLTALTGVVLFAIAAQNFITNAVFFVKLGAVAIAVVCLRRIKILVFDQPGDVAAASTPRVKVLAGGLLFGWASAVVGGRLTAYHAYTVVRSVAAVVALAVIVAVAIVLTHYVRRLMGWTAAPVRRAV